MLNIVQHIRVQGTKPYYEDAAGVEGNFVWVIDGATSLVGDDGDDGGVVARFAATLSDALHVHAADASDAADLRELLHAAVAEATRQTGPIDVEHPWEVPSAALVLAHVEDDTVRLIQAADVEWHVIGLDGGAGSVSEPVFLQAMERTEQDIAALDHDTPAARRDVYRGVRATMNSTGGYPVVQYGMSRPLEVGEVVVHADAAEVIMHSDGWPKLVREGLGTRLLGTGGFDDATFLHVAATH